MARTSLVFLSGSFLEKTLDIINIHEKIIALGDVFTDDRLTDLIQLHPGIVEIVIDAPLTVPPCVACLRPRCPGVLCCEDLDVAYMLALGEKAKKQKTRRHHRQINPQTWRLWDCLAVLDEEEVPLEPTYHANQAPVVVRAMTLKKRLAHFSHIPGLKETSVPHLVSWLGRSLALSGRVLDDYKTMQWGESARRKILHAIQQENWLRSHRTGPFRSLEQFASSLPLFQGLMAALAAALCAEGMCPEPPAGHLPHTGWVYLPRI